MEHRFHNIAGNDDRPLQFSLGITVSLADHTRDLGNRLTTLQDNHPFAGLMNTVEDGQAPSLEIGCINRRHVTSIHGRSCHVKRVGKNVKKRKRKKQVPSPHSYLSTSPSTMSMLPIAATTSETNPPFTISGRAWRFTNDGPRTRSL